MMKKFDSDRFINLFVDVIAVGIIVLLLVMISAPFMRFLPLLLPALVSWFDEAIPALKIALYVIGAALLITSLLYLLAPRSWGAHDEQPQSPEEKKP